MDRMNADFVDAKVLYLVRGMPGSGKSTYAKALAEIREMNHFEADMFFIDDNGNYVFDVTKLNDAHRWCQGSAREALKCDGEVVVSNTFTTWKEIHPYYQIAMDHGAVIHIVNMTKQYENIHSVPQQTLEKMKARYASEALIRSYDLYDLMEWSNV